MRDTKQMIDEYRNGNFEARLHMFLDCPSMRDDFMEIELLEQQANENSPS